MRHRLFCNSPHVDVFQFSEHAYFSLVSGHGMTCAIRKDDNSIECWGRTPPMPKSNYNSKVYQSVTLGKSHMCAVDEEGAIQCWSYGGETTKHLVPLGLVVRP